MNKWILWSIGIAGGAVAGFVYWSQVGCVTGTCPITASPVNSSLYGGVMGFLLAGMFVKEKTESPKD